MREADRRAWAALIEDPWAFCLRLQIQDVNNQTRPIGRWLFEQDRWMRALCSTERRRKLGVKPRQVGWTTGTMAFLFWKLYTSSRGRRALQMAHEDSAVTRLARMTKVFHRRLPRMARGKVTISNKWITEFGHNGAAFQRILAGGAGQGRGDTYNDYHATEMSKWKQGTAAVASEAGLSADEEAFGSALATIHDPSMSIIVESTGNGPHGLYHKLFLQASTDPSWDLVFVSWLEVPRYRLELTPAVRSDLSKELDDEERELIGKRGASLEQIAWRRDRMRALRMTPLMFRREFPTVITDPFKLQEAGWFDLEILDRMLHRHVQHQVEATPDNELVVFTPPEEGRTYFIGMDTAGGVGGDEACIQVLRDDAVHVATWASRWAREAQQAHMLSRIGGMYFRARALVERNRHGVEVIERVSKLGGVRLYKDAEGDDWWTNPQTKIALMSHARELIESGWAAFRDFQTVLQLQTVVEAKGKIQAKQGAHDDRAMAGALALWCGRETFRRDIVATETEADRLERERQKAVEASTARIQEQINTWGSRGDRR